MTSDCVEVDRFHRFVKPTTCVIDTPHAVPFARALNELNEFFDRVTKNGQRSLLVLTCGDWDLKTQIPYQAAISKVPVPQWALSWG